MKKSIYTLLVSASFVCAAHADTTNPVKATSPTDMTCQEYIDLNPKAMTPVAFWVVNKDTQYKEGDFVDMEDVETVSAPMLLEICHAKPESKLVQWIDKIK